MSEDTNKYDDISNLIFDGYITDDVFILDSFITLKTLSTNVIEKITNKYKYCNSNYNFEQIIETLSYAIKSIGGVEINDSEKLYKKLLQLHSLTVYFLYKNFTILSERISKSSKLLTSFVKTDESRYKWNVLKGRSGSLNLEDLNKINNLQVYWFNLNLNKDSFENEKNEWRRVEYMTNSICSFVSPKAYKQVKDKMNITKQFDDPEEVVEEEENEMEEIADREAKLKRRKNFVNADKTFIDEIKRRKDESKEDHIERVNELMKRQMSGEAIDEHDKIIREKETKIFEKKIREKRGLMLIRKELRRRRKMEQSENMNEVEVLGDDERMNEIEEEIKKQGFYYENTSYFDIVKDKTYMSIPKKEKQRIFDELMKEKFDIEKGVEIYLKSLYKKDNKNIQTIENVQKENSRNIEKNVKSAAEKAAMMNVDLNKRRSIIKKDDDDLDKIVFN